MPKDTKKNTSKPKAEKGKKANPILEDDNEVEEEELTDTETDEETVEDETDTDAELSDDDEDEVEEEPVKKPVKGSKTGKANAKATADEDRPLIERDPVKPRSDNRIETLLKADARAVKDTLSKEPKVRIFVPLGIGEKKGAHAYETVTINGYRMVLMKGEYSTVPQSVANMIESHYNMTPEDTEAGQAFRLDRNRTKEDGMTTDDALLNA
ncbi:hypothetical protein GW916_01910 [bacterium]|nr:hypothetical protein [bacterium]